jgi:ABC-type nitrate/sulfonate/bicarbonate transport system ATPase subunit
MTNDLMHVQSLAYTHDGADKTLFENFSMNFAAGKCHVLLGRSGGGKSTLLRLIAGLIKPQAGQVIIEGESKPGSQQFLFQDYDSFPWLTVFDNVRKGSGPPPYPSHEDVEKILSRVGLLQAKDLYPRALSGGMKKRLGFARCLVRQPRLLLLDEPFASLDIALRLEMYALLQELIAEHGTTVILVSHDLHEALLLGDTIIVLGGQSVQMVAHINNALPYPRSEEVVTDPFYAVAHAKLTAAIHNN